MEINMTDKRISERGGLVKVDYLDDATGYARAARGYIQKDMLDGAMANATTAIAHALIALVERLDRVTTSNNVGDFSIVIRQESKDD